MLTNIALHRVFGEMPSTELPTRFYYFDPWTDVQKSVHDRLKHELDVVSPVQRVLDLLHQAAFRNAGLNNSIRVPEYNVGTFTPDQVRPIPCTSYYRVVLVAV